MRTTLSSGAAYGLASAGLFGASTPLAKLLVGVIDPWLLAGLLYLGSGLGLFLFGQIKRWFKQAPAEPPLRQRDLPWLGAAIATGGVVGPVLLMIGLASTPASAAALLLNLEGVATIAIAWTIFREHFDRRILLGAVAILAGALVLSWRGGADQIGLGAVAIAGACLAWGVDNNLTRKVSGADPVQVAMLKGLVAGTANVSLAFFLGAHLPAMSEALAAAVLGLFGYGVSLVFFVIALRHVGAARTGAYFSTAPFIGAALSIAFLGEALTINSAVAAFLMAVGVYLHVAERHDHLHAHEAREHEHAHVHDDHHRHEHGPADPPGEPHTHWHRHAPIVHSHPHFPDLHHDHKH